MRRHLLVIALLLLVTFGVFSRVLQADFVAWDDELSVTGNTFIQGLDAHRLGWMFTNVSYVMRYKPLGWLSYALIYAGAGLNPLAYHLANLVFHCLNVVLLYFLIRELLLRARAPQPETEREPRRLGWCAGLGALAWAVHPLRVEPVAWATDLAYCQSLSFLLISLWCYLRANAKLPPAASRKGFYWGAVGAFALSMLFYPFAFGYALVLVVLDIYPLRRFAYGRAHLGRPIDRGRDKGLTLPLPPNRTGGSPASGSPVSGFVVVRLYASTRVLLPRTTAHSGQTIGWASVDEPLRFLYPVHPAAIAADCAVVFERSHPHSQTCSLCCAGSNHTSPAMFDSRPPRFPSDSALLIVRSWP
jgi:hypothetical protein